MKVISGQTSYLEINRLRRARKKKMRKKGEVEKFF
jgi:hypothetical protein